MIRQSAIILPAVSILLLGFSAWAPPAEMADAHTLVFNHDKLQRAVEELPNGIKSITTTDDPELLAVLQRHPVDMDARLDAGFMVRCWDPLFAELGARHQEVELKATPIENGIEVVATSEDPEVVKLIRAHAVKVSDMAARGPAAMRESTPLPKDYVANEAVAEASPRGACAAQGRGNDKGCCQAKRGQGENGGKACCGIGKGQSEGHGKGCCKGGGGRRFRGGREG